VVRLNASRTAGTTPAAAGRSYGKTWPASLRFLRSALM
jgi:hypothetical protein